MTNVIEAETKAQGYSREMVGNQYRHFKGNIYEVEHIGIDTENLSLRDFTNRKFDIGW